MNQSCYAKHRGRLSIFHLQLQAAPEFHVNTPFRVACEKYSRTECPFTTTIMGGFETKDRTCGSTAVTADSSWGSNPNIQPSKSTTCPSPPQSKSSFSCWQILYLFNLPQNFSYWPNESSLLELLHCSDKQSLCSNRAPYSISTPCSEPLVADKYQVEAQMCLQI